MGDEAQKTWEKYPAALPEGSILAGQYTIQDVLGQGGFGITYLAEDYQSKEKVAVKEFFPESMVMRQGGTPQVTAYSGDRQENFRYGMQSFLDEAKILAQFQGNPNIVGVRSYFEENGTAYFVMDYIEGTTLKAYIQKSGGKLGWEEVWDILSPVMDALEAVHRKGIIHRDVTPDNIFIADDHTVKLLDFGAARYSLGDRSRSLDVVLKAGYAPKEQYTRRGRQGPYTDVYSLAACFYSALCGYLPPESLDRLDEDDLVSLSTRGVKLPKGVEEAILKALEIRAEDRFQTVGEFKKAILDSLGEKGEPKAESKTKPKPDPNSNLDSPALNPNLSIKFLKKNSVKMAGVAAAIVLIGIIFAVQGGNARQQEEATVVKTEETEQRNAQDTNGSTAEKEASDKEESSDVPVTVTGSKPAATTATPIAETKAYVNYKSIVVRQGASPDHEVMGFVTGNTSVIITGEANGANGRKWYQIRYTNQSGREVIGFVRADLLTVGDPPVAAAPAEPAEPLIEEEEAVPSILMAEEKRELDEPLDAWNDKLNSLEGVLGKADLKPGFIKKVTFLNTQENKPEDAWDVSSRKDGSVMAWIEERDNEYFDLYIAGEGKVVLESGSYLFCGYINLEEIYFNGCVDTSQVTNMEHMFNGCYVLKELDLSSFDTSQVTNMECMFCDCCALKELNVSGFNTSRVTDMGYMFSNCYALEELDMSSFNTSRVTNMGYMFCYCEGLEELNVNGFDTSRVTYMGYMFYGCIALEELDVSGFDTSRVTDMPYMFDGCTSLPKPNVSWYDRTLE